MNSVTTGKVMWFLIGFCLGAIVGFVTLTLRGRTMPEPIVIMPPEPTAVPEPTATPGPVQVYVNGAVVNAGVFDLPAGALIRDAVESAGGFTGTADSRQINLAQPVVDGMQIYVPTVEETEEEPVAIINVPAAAPSEIGTGGVAPASGGLININTAGATELEELPGIGPALAQRIVDYRNDNGLFASIEEIQNVSGIGPATFEEIKELITVE